MRQQIVGGGAAGARLYYVVALRAWLNHIRPIDVEDVVSG